jgi:hypothetical protein
MPARYPLIHLLRQKPEQLLQVGDPLVPSGLRIF